MLPNLLYHPPPLASRPQIDQTDLEDERDERDERDSSDDLPGNAESDLKYFQAITNAFRIIICQSSGVYEAATNTIHGYTNTYYNKEPYHTSTLSGIGWVNELLTGHPEHIRTELGVHRHVFFMLLNLLREAGLTDSKHVLLEEQLAIFLYASITGLSVRHLGERFQCSNDTISRYVIHPMFY